MQPQLKQNIINLVKQRGLSIRQLERNAGLHVNYINNILYGNSKNPGLDPIAKISEVLGVSIDELIGKKSEHKNYALDITRKDIFLEVVNYLSTAIKTSKNSTLKLDKLFNAIHEIYEFSLKKGMFDKEFADWLINTQLR